MTKRELAVYEVEQRLIRKHFPDLKPRPIKIMRRKELDGLAGRECLEVNERVLRRKGKDNLESVLKHELIHYQLGDSGKQYRGHGTAFLRRAAELGIVGDYELDRCFSGEEDEHTAHERKVVEVPRETYRKRIDETFAKLTRLIKRLPTPQRIGIYRELTNLTVTWEGFAEAVERGQQTVRETVFVKKRGRKGKSLKELLAAYAAVKAEIKKLGTAFEQSSGDSVILRKLNTLETKEFQLIGQMEDNYGKMP